VPWHLRLTVTSLAQARLILDVKQASELGFRNTGLLLDDSSQKVHTSLRAIIEGLSESSSKQNLVLFQLDGYHALLDEILYNIQGRAQEVDEFREAASSIKQTAKETLADMRNMFQSQEQTTMDIQRGLQRFLAARECSPTNSTTPHNMDPSGSNAHSSSSSAKLEPFTLVESTNGCSAWPIPMVEPLLNIQAAVRRRCLPTCRCQCHKFSKIQSPSMLSNILGQFFLRYNSISIWKSRPCNDTRCQNSSKKSVRLNYMFPQWMLRRAVYLSISWLSVMGDGVSLHLKVPRAIPANHDVWRAIKHNNIIRLQHLFSQKRVFNTDVSESGRPLLLVGYMHCELRRDEEPTNMN
jgi:hypothetical protein